MKTISNGVKKQGLVNLIREELARAGVRPADRLAVAVSGGPDSMSLVDLLRQSYQARLDQLIVVHIHHGLRKAADREAELVRQYCHRRRLQLAVEEISIKLGRQGGGLEERARELRYAALQDTARKYDAKWIVTAHTADDQVETVIANWLRGSAVRGLGGMRLVAGNIIRPLLGVWKEELLAYAKRRKLRYAVDASNASPRFTRNRIRLQLLPRMRKFNKQIDFQLWQNSQIWQQVDRVLRELAGQYFKKVGKLTKGGAVLSVSKLRELSPLMQIEVVKLALEGSLTGLGRLHFAEVVKLLASPRQRVAKRRLGGRLFASKAYDKITISQR